MLWRGSRVEKEDAEKKSFINMERNFKLGSMKLIILMMDRYHSFT